MTWTRHTATVLNEVQTAWDHVRAALNTIHPNHNIRPSQATQIFVGNGGDANKTKFTVGPVVFKVPEKASHQDSALYVVIKGWLELLEPAGYGGLRSTYTYGTQVGYFRYEADLLKHVYGVHYDMDGENHAHPVFHAQIASQAELGEEVSKHFHEGAGIIDLSKDWLGNVRTPTAQMDAFSVITQIAADHLSSDTSTQEEKEAFVRLRNACDFFTGAAPRLESLTVEPATHRYRSTHWYDRIA